MAEPGQSFELPQAVPEQQPESEGQLQQLESQKAAVETVGKAQESSTGKQAPQVFPATQTPIVIPVDEPAGGQPATPLSTSDDPATAQLPAKDGDLIEKEWVDRAKTIIAKTADDPHKQKHEVSKIKAAYIQKRFNKAIKTDEAA